MEVPAKFRSVWADFRYLFLTLIFIVTAAFLTSCGSGGTTVTITDGTGSGDLSFNIDYLANVTTGETTSITAYVSRSIDLPEGGTGTKPAQGVTVTFEFIQAPSFGSLDASSVVTIDGVATVNYTAGPIDSVADIVRVSITNVGYQDATINVNPPGTGTISVSVTANPNVLEAVTEADADNQATIAATVTSSAGALVGEDVTFTTSAGSLCDYPNCTATATTAQTDANGIARIILQSSTNLETADVEARVGLSSGATTVAFIAGPAAGFELFASPTNLTADNNSTSTITAVVTDSAGHLVADGATVNFSIKNTSTGSGSFVEIPATDQTTSGVATVTFRAGDTPGSVNIRASSGGVDSDDADPTYGDGLITLISEFVGSVSVAVDPATLTADNASKAQVTATVLNSDGFPVNAGTSVTFTTSGGLLDTDFGFQPNPGPSTSVSTETIGNTGEATAFLRSSFTAGQYFVTATAGGRANVAQVNFIAGLADATNSSLTVSPTTIPADGSSTAILTMTARDSNNNPVADGKVVGFSASQGVISNQTTTTAGVATATLTSSNTPGVVNLSASIDTITETATVTFGIAAGANPNSIVLVLSDTTLTVESPTGSDSINIQATVFDASGNPIGVDCDQNITFTKVAGPADVTLDGSPTSVTKTTNGGVASVTLNSGTTPGTVRVQVTASQNTSDCSAGTPISVTTTAIVITSGPAANLLVYPAQNVVDNQDGTISQAMNALLTDTYGNPVEDDTAVFFSLNAEGQLYGTICGSGVTGNSELDTTCNTTGGAGIKGVAHSLMTWVSEGIFEPFIVTAETQTLTGMISDTYDGNFPGVAPIAIDVTITPSSAPGGYGGTGGISVIAEYHDGASFPNPISGVDLDFTSSSAFATVVTPSATTDINGFASTTVTTTTCRVTNTSVTISASDPPYSGSAQMTILATEPTASFTVSGTSPTFTFSNTSTEPAGYNYSYLWSFGDTTTSTLESPSHTYTAPGTYTVTLTVTNNDAPGGCSDTDTDSVTVP